MMPEPKFPRKFKFVGGPSRKRRRLAPPAAGETRSTLPHPTSVVTAATVTNDTQRFMLPISTLHAGSSVHSSPDGNDGYVGPGTAPSDEDAVTTTTQPVVTSFANEHQVLPATVLPQATEVFESLLGWPASSDLSMATGVLGSAVEFNDPFSLFGAPFNLATSPGIGLTNGAAHESPLDSSREYLPRNQGPSAMSPEGFPKSTEHISGETDPELGDRRSIPRSIGDNIHRLFAQCKSEDALVPLEGESEVRATDAARQMTESFACGL